MFNKQDTKEAIMANIIIEYILIKIKYKLSVPEILIDVGGIYFKWRKCTLNIKYDSFYQIYSIYISNNILSDSFLNRRKNIKNRIGFSSLFSDIDNIIETVLRMENRHPVKPNSKNKKK